MVRRSLQNGAQILRRLKLSYPRNDYNSEKVVGDSASLFCLHFLGGGFLGSRWWLVKFQLQQRWQQGVRLYSAGAKTILDLV